MVGAIVYESFHEGMLECIGGLKRWLSIYVFPLISFGGEYIGVIGDMEIEHGYNITYERFSDITEALDKYSDLKLCVLAGGMGCQVLWSPGDSFHTDAAQNTLRIKAIRVDRPQLRLRS